MPRKCSGGSGFRGRDRRGRSGLGRDVRRPVRQGRVLADGAERDPAEAALGELLEDERGVRRELDAEALGELGDPGELVRHGRDHRAAQALDAALEVDEGAVALEVARAREDEVGPADGEALEHRDRDHDLGLLGERADGGVGGGLVARDDQQADRLRVRPRRRPSSPPRRRRRRARSGVDGRWKAAQPGFASSPSRWPSSASRAPPPPARPDQISTAPLGATTRAPRSFLPSLGSATWTISAPLRRAWRIQRSTIGARSATGSSPSTTTISASPIVESGARKASSAVRDRLGQHGRVRARGPGAAACRARRPARPSPSRRARSRSRPCAPRSSASASSSASSQRERP